MRLATRHAAVVRPIEGYSHAVVGGGGEIGKREAPLLMRLAFRCTAVVLAFWAMPADGSGWRAGVVMKATTERTG